MSETTAKHTSSLSSYVPQVSPGTLTQHMRAASAHGTATLGAASSAAKTIFQIGRVELRFLRETRVKSR
jgi:hypothetical protein